MRYFIDLDDRCIAKVSDRDHAIAMAKRFEISREAAIRRYVDLHKDCLAAVFSKQGAIRYIVKSETFPTTSCWTGDPLGDHPPRQQKIP